jgi:hypothetical protein
MGTFLLLAAGLPEDIAILSPETRVLVSFIKLRILLTLKSLHLSENIVSTIKVSSTFRGDCNISVFHMECYTYITCDNWESAL